jgi:glycosyltransferase involved in cell wall biosynthesis/GT2 family glycosyltransferase
MTLEEQISELIPDGPGEVVWLGPQNAQRLIDGIEIGPTPPRAIVLQGVLGRFQNPVEVLRELAAYLDGNGWVIAVAASRMNPYMNGGFTRRELLDMFGRAGYDVGSCTLVSDPRIPWMPISMGGAPGARSPEEAEEIGSSALIVAARLPREDILECSIVTTGPLELVPDNAELIEVVGLWDGEHRARAWNRGAQLATGKYLAFLDAGSTTSERWLEGLLETFQSRPGIAVTGANPLAFGPESIPCHQLPFPIEGGTSALVPAVDGCGMVVERAKFVEAGGFDPRLGPPFDGPDLCLRLRARGMEIAHSAAASVTLPAVATTGRTSDGPRYFMFKWGGQIPADPIEPKAPVPRPRSSKAPAPVLWSAPLLQRSGYGEEARSFVRALDRAGIAVLANPTDWHTETQLQRRAVRRLGALAVTEAPDRFINVVNSFPAARMLIGNSKGKFPLFTHFTPHPRAVRNIGRTMYETDRIPDHWVDACNQMDEVWVPTDFNIETFSRSGVDRNKLFRVPGAIDTELFDPRLPPSYVPGAQGFVFLSVMAWSLRKGWDVLVRAFKEEFDHGEDVTLVLKVLPHWNRTMAQHQTDLDSFIRHVLGRDPRERPRILVVSRDMSVEEMPRLYGAANAFVLPSRGEGYGRPYLEAMAMGLPTIGTRSGGNLDFMNDDNAYLVDCKIVPVPEAGIEETPDYRGHQWAEPDVMDLRRVMRTVFEEREESKKKSEEGRRVALERHSWRPVARAIEARLKEGGVRPLRSRLPDLLPVTWEGPHRIAFGIAEVNREIGAALKESGNVGLRQSETDEPQPWLWGRPPEVTVRHQWPPNFEPPKTGRWVTYQPWEYGSLPSAWVEPMNRVVDEVWVPTTYVRDCYVRSGVDAGKVAVVPYGIDPDRFHPEVAPIELSTLKKHRFLFVGGTIARKGVDILLDAYVATFKAEDDVCLVIKDLGASSFYRGQGMGERIKQLQADRQGPEILYLDAEMPAADMPGLFTACQCLVHPYRGEGFGLPIAEAMACGLPVIVPRHGACLDFCDESVAYLVDAKELRWPEARVGATATVEHPWWAVVDRASLGAAMRHVVENPEEARAVGRRASTRIRGEWTWARSALVATSRLEALSQRSPRLTACIVVKDEERGLGRCLKSLRGLVDEVVVVDTGSTDRTADVARQHNAKVRQFSWSNDFAAARNEALRHATGDWILIIDADESLDAAGRKELRWIVNSQMRSTHFLRQITHASRDPEGVERLLVRLFPNDPGLRFSGPINEVLVDGSGTRVEARPSGVVLHHVGAPAGRRRRLRRVLTLLEDDAKNQRENARPMLDLTRAYLDLGLAAEAEEEAHRAIDLLAGAPAGVDFLRPEAHCLRARALRELGRFAEATSEGRAAVRLNPELAEAHATLAAALAAAGQLEPALIAYRAALQCPPIAAFRPVDRAASGRRSRRALEGIQTRIGYLVETS